MSEITPPQAAKILNKSVMTIYRKIKSGVLPARQEGTGKRRFTFIDLEELRSFAHKHGYQFNESIAAKYNKDRTAGAN